MSGPRAYRLKPVEVEAIQHTGPESKEPIREWLISHGLTAQGRIDAGTYVIGNGDVVFIENSFGLTIARPTHWIVRTDSGSFHVYTPDEFAEMFHPNSMPIVCPHPDRDQVGKCTRCGKR